MQQGAVRSTVTPFIVRVWNDDAKSEMHGEIEHLVTGERRRFAGASSLVEIIEAWRRET